MPTTNQEIAESRLRRLLRPKAIFRRDAPAFPLDNALPRRDAPSLASGNAPPPRDAPAFPSGNALPRGGPNVPAPSSPRLPQSFDEFRTAIAAQAPALDPGRPGLRVLLLIGILAAIVGGIYAWRSQPEPAPLPAPPPLTGSASAPTVAVSSPRAPEVTVHVTGKVRRPGVYTLSGGSRVTDAVTAAGGPRGGSPMGSVNLARRLIDGEQIVVGAPSGPLATPLTPADPTTTAVIDLNTATPEQLEQLPGVGEVLARRIAEFRTANGGFRAIEQLRDVSGIGPRKYEELKTKVRV